jgi:hypothetical protein
MEWISVKDRLPGDEEVLVIDHVNDIYVAFRHPPILSDEYFWMIKCECEDSSSRPGRVTHWMPLPEAPKE